MVQQLLDDLLHLRTRHTNMMIPFSNYIGLDKFPKQTKDMIGKTIKLQYRNYNMVDHDESTLIAADKYDPHNIFEDKFIIVRHDDEEPYRFIAIAKDYSKILVDNNYTRYNDINSYVYKYPIQCTNLIGFNVHNQYPAIENTVSAIILRADVTEPSYCVLVESIGGKIRFLLGDECMSKLGDRDPDTFQIPPLTLLGSGKSFAEVTDIIKHNTKGKTLWS